MQSEAPITSTPPHTYNPPAPLHLQSNCIATTTREVVGGDGGGGGRLVNCTSKIEMDTKPFKKK